MTGSAQDSLASGAHAPRTRRQRPGPGHLVAGTGAVAMLVSPLLPWYELRLQVAGPVGGAAFATVHAGSMHATCSPPPGPCSVSASVGLLAAGIWDWRLLIVAGAAATLLVLVIGTVLPGRLWQGSRSAQLVTVVASATAVFVLASIAMNPLSTAGTSWPGLSASLSYGAAVGVAGVAAAIAGGLLLRRDAGGQPTSGSRDQLSLWAPDD